MCEQIFKKRQRPNTNQIIWILKKNTMSPIIAVIASQLLIREKFRPRQIQKVKGVLVTRKIEKRSSEKFA